MPLGGYPVLSDTIASGASTSAGIKLQNGWSYINVCVGTMSTAAALQVQGSPDDGTTFYNAFQYVASSTTQAAPIVIASNVGTNGGVIVLPGGFNYLRFIASAVVSGGVTFKLVCSD